MFCEGAMSLVVASMPALRAVFGRPRKGMLSRLASSPPSPVPASKGPRLPPARPLSVHGAPLPAC